MTEPILERDPRLRLVVGRLVEAYAPERIYLFGSVARGDADQDSDYDLMVVVPDDAPLERRGSRLACQALRRTGIAAGRSRVDSEPIRATRARRRVVAGHD